MLRAFVAWVVLGTSVSAAEPVLAIADLHVQCLLGGSRGSQWLTTEKVAPRLKGGEKYRLVRRAGIGDTVTGKKPASGGPPCEATLTVGLSEESEEALAVMGTWNVFPRRATDIQPMHATYERLLAPFLQTQGITAPAEIRQLVKADLDGDGKDEVIAVMGHAQDYSGVVVRSLKSDVVATSVLDLEKGPHEGDMDLSTYAAPMIADLNGDGRMEIVLFGQYAEGLFTLVYALEGGKLRRVVSCTCGG